MTSLSENNTRMFSSTCSTEAEKLFSSRPVQTWRDSSAASRVSHTRAKGTTNRERSWRGWLRGSFLQRRTESLFPAALCEPNLSAVSDGNLPGGAGAGWHGGSAALRPAADGSGQCLGAPGCAGALRPAPGCASPDGGAAAAAEARPPLPPAARCAGARQHRGRRGRLNPMKPVFRPAAAPWLTTLARRPAKALCGGGA